MNIKLPMARKVVLLRTAGKNALFNVTVIDTIPLTCIGFINIPYTFIQ